MNTIPDMNKKGVFAVISPIGRVMFDSFQDTPYMACHAFCARHKYSMEHMFRDGYTVAEFSRTGQVPVEMPESTKPAALPPGVSVPKTVEAWNFRAPGQEESARQAGQVLETILTGALGVGATTVEEGVRIRKLMRSLIFSYDYGIGTGELTPAAILDRTIEQALGLPIHSLVR